MTIHRTTQWIAGFSVLTTLLLIASPNRAAQLRAEAKWETKRTTPPESLDEIIEFRILLPTNGLYAGGPIDMGYL